VFSSLSILNAETIMSVTIGDPTTTFSSQETEPLNIDFWDHDLKEPDYTLP
jgi:hypothetical protein